MIAEFRINIGYMTEDAVQYSVESVFSPDFVFRSPRREGGRELTDVLSLYDDVGVVIQVKAQAVSTTSDNADDGVDWAAKNLKKAVRQVAGAVRAIRDGRVHHVENARRGRVPFNRAEYPWLYGLIIMHHQSPPYNPVTLDHRISELGFALHVLSYRDFWNLSTFLNTPADMINYLEHRTDVLLPTLRPNVHEEQHVFNYYLENLENLYAFRAKKRGYKFAAQDAQPYAQEMRKLVTGKHPHVQDGLVIDHMISRIHNLDSNLEAIDVGGKRLACNSNTYTEIATELGSIPRVRRIALGHQFLKTARLAADTGKMHFKVTYSPGRSDCVLFMVNPPPRSERKERMKELLAMTALAKNYYYVHRAIGIATESAGQMGSSYDFVFLDSEPVKDERTHVLGKETFGETGSRLIDI